MQLHSFFNSSTSYRVRIALNLKGVPHHIVGVDIRTGAHRLPAFAPDLNATAAVPVLVDGDESLGQSLAIIDWLDSRFPEPRLIPAEPRLRARVLELSYLIACDIHPVNNLRVLKYLTSEFGISQAARDGWYAHWIAEGMAGVERLLARHGTPPFCFGDAPTLADCCLVPQIANALRTGCDTVPYPRAMAVYAHALTVPAFQAAMPANQPDFG
ncbi:MAG: maleylacetoacetate isomerase [Polymorphobacter sp.]